jgi:hypothetical protein
MRWCDLYFMPCTKLSFSKNTWGCYLSEEFFDEVGAV